MSKLVAHVMTSVRGGAGIAALRAATAQNAHGPYEARAFTRDQEFNWDPDLGIPDLVQSVELSPRQRFTSSTITGLNRYGTRAGSVLFTPLSISATRRLRSLLVDYNYVHLHNIYNLLSTRDIPRVSTATILVTLHDERQITNGCHYTMGCENFQSDCRSCPQSRVSGTGLFPRARDNQALFRCRPNGIFFVAPSLWIAAQARLAGIDEERVFHVPNPINTALFTPDSRSKHRNALGLPQDATVVAWQPGKNNAVLIDALCILRGNLLEHGANEIVVLTPGQPPQGIPFLVRSAGELKTEADRAAFWSAADIGVSASKMDNFPNVVLESLAVATPFVIPNVGGAAEAIELTRGGVCVQEPESTHLASALTELVLRPEIRRSLGESGRSGVVRQYSYPVVSRRLEEMYSSIGTRGS